MDRTERYRALIKRILEECAEQTPVFEGAQMETVVDDQGGHYLLWEVGWRGSRRIHSCYLHVDLKDGKIWVQHDGIYGGITQQLLDSGVPEQDIVLGFHPPHARRLTPFAVA